MWGVSVGDEIDESGGDGGVSISTASIHSGQAQRARSGAATSTVRQAELKPATLASETRCAVSLEAKAMPSASNKREVLALSTAADRAER